MDIQLLNTIKVHSPLTFIHFPSQRYRCYFVTHISHMTIPQSHFVFHIPAFNSKTETFKLSPARHGKVLFGFGTLTYAFIAPETIRHLEKKELRSLSTFLYPSPTSPLHDHLSQLLQRPLTALCANTVATVH